MPEAGAAVTSLLMEGPKKLARSDDMLTTGTGAPDAQRFELLCQVRTRIVDPSRAAGVLVWLVGLRLRDNASGLPGPRLATAVRLLVEVGGVVELSTTPAACRHPGLVSAQMTRSSSVNRTDPVAGGFLSPPHPLSGREPPQPLRYVSL
jgi:hypothetical protein